MQTFLPYSDFYKSAECLDYRRLGKQRVECLQILNVLQNPTQRAWQNHPAVNMWRGYAPALCEYGVVICEEWKCRGYKDTCLEKIKSKTNGEIVYPPWIGGEIHETHRSNLIRKFPEFYLSKFKKDTRLDLPYIWPV